MMWAVTDDKALEVLKDPGFAQWIVYLMVAIYVMEKVGSAVLRVTGREMPGRREIHGTVTTVEPVRHADQAEVDEIKDEVQGLREENQAQHQAAAVAGSQRVAALSEGIDAKTSELEDKMEAGLKELLLRMDTGFKDLGDSLRGVMIQQARHDEAIPHINERIAALTARYNETIPALHGRIDAILKGRARQG